MKITFTVYVKQQPEHNSDDLSDIPMIVAELFANALGQDELRFIKSFEVMYDTEQTSENYKIDGLSYELLKQLCEKLRKV